MRHGFAVQVGPFGFRIGSDWRRPIAELERLYAGYPGPQDDIPDFTVRLFARRPWRRVLRPSVEIGGDFMLAEAAPLPLAQGLLAAEMAMNLQVALGCRRFLLLHAAVVERDGRALILSGESGSGKSTLAALLALRGWRLLADEFALIEPETGLVHPFPRPISLKNAAIGAVAAAHPDARWGPELVGTPKGTIRHLIAPPEAVARMAGPATPALLLFPRFGFAAEERPVGPSEVFIRLTEASTNYVTLGERGFVGLTRLVRDVPVRAIDYPDAATGLAQVEALWRGC